MDDEIKQLLRKLREEKGLTQQQFAELLTISTTAVSSYEIGKATPPIKIIKRICNTFNVRSDSILGLDSKKWLCLDGLSDEEVSLVEELITLLRKKQRK